MKSKILIVLLIFILILSICVGYALTSVSDPTTSTPGITRPDMETVTLPETTVPETTVAAPSCEQNGHSYSNWKVSTEPSCTQQGIENQICCVCGHSVSRPIAVLEHVYDAPCIIKNNTCEEDGLSQCKCLLCGEIQETVLPAFQHSYGAWTVKISPSCTQNGVEVAQCVRCLKEITQQIDMWGHDFRYTSTKQPTITTEGYELYNCSHCGAEKRTLLAKLSAVDADMCGDSLLGKVMPNAPFPEFTQQALDRWNREVTQDDSLQAGPILFPAGDYWTNLCAWKHPYRYLTYSFDFVTYIYGSAPSEFYCWATDKRYAEQQLVYQRVFEILSELGIDESVTKKEAVIRINNWIRKHKYYEYDLSKEDSFLYHSIFGSAADCHNYALAFQTICLGAGIECHYYVSTSMNHAWNKVYFSDGTYLWVDACWNDTANYPNQYLLLTTEQLLKSHTLQA